VFFFVSFAVVNWIDVYVREAYFNDIVESLKYCMEHKGMEIYSWCIMPSHIHLIFSAKSENPSDVLRDFKRYTSTSLQKLLEANVGESRREWILWMMDRAGAKNSNNKGRQFWQQHNKPIELWSNDVIDQKLHYIHNNPVAAGFVSEALHWKYSSAIDYSGGRGLIKLSIFE
jgi:REP element-mobilizing transposase RayT